MNYNNFVGRGQLSSGNMGQTYCEAEIDGEGVTELVQVWQNCSELPETAVLGFTIRTIHTICFRTIRHGRCGGGRRSGRRFGALGGDALGSLEGTAARECA